MATKHEELTMKDLLEKTNQEQLGTQFLMLLNRPDLQDKLFGVRLQDVAAARTATNLTRRIQNLVDRGLDLEDVTTGSHRASALHLAARWGTLEVVKTLLAPPFNWRGMLMKPSVPEGNTAIHFTVMGTKSEKNLEVLEVLLDLFPLQLIGGGIKHVKDLVNNFGETPLHQAVGLGRTDMAQLLISRGADVNAADNSGATPLHFAARCGQVSSLELLHNHHADLQRTNNGGMTAAHYAARNLWADVVVWLAYKGVELDKPDDLEGFTALHWAAERGGVSELVRIMAVAAGTALSSTDKSGRSVLHLVEKRGRDHARRVLRELDSHSLLSYTRKTLNRIVAYGDADLNNKMRRFMIFRFRSPQCKDDIVARFKSLARNAAGSVGRGSTTDFNLFSPLEIAAVKGNSDALEAVLHVMETVLLPDEVTAQRKSALQLALHTSQLEFAAALLRDGYVSRAEFVEWIKDLKGTWAPYSIIESMQHRHKKLARKYRDLGRILADSKKLNEEVPFAYHLIHKLKVNARIVEFTKLIEEQNALEEIVNEVGSEMRMTALHWATIACRRDIVEELCKIKHCRPNIKDKYDNTAFEYAVVLQNEEIQGSLRARKEVSEYLDSLYKDRELSVDAVNAVLVGSALIASITFAGFLQPPLGYPDPEEGHVAIDKAGVKLFWICNALSFFFAMGSALAGARGVLPRPDVYIGDMVVEIRWILLAAATMLVLSISFVLLAFVAAGSSVLPPSLKDQAYIIATALLGGPLCAAMLLWFVKGLLYLHRAAAASAWPKPPPVLIPHPSTHEERRGGFKSELLFKDEQPWKDGLQELPK